MENKGTGSISIPKVSVIITTHNRLELLKRAIDSVQKQDYCNYELIVVDDASVDGTREYCENQKFNYIYISQSESKGGNYARNLGIKVSKGRYCAFLDDDDYWKDTYLKKMDRLIEEKKCGMVYSGVTYEIKSHDNISYNDIIPNACGDLSTKILFSSFTSTSSMMVERELLTKVGMFDEKLAAWQDYELIIRIAQQTEIYNFPEPLMVYRKVEKGGTNVSNKYKVWCDAVRYIHKKHHLLYNKLDQEDQLRVKDFTWFHAINKARSSGYAFHGYLYVLFRYHFSSVFLKKHSPLLLC